MTKHEDSLWTLLRHAAPPPVQADEDEIDALALLRIVRRRIWIIALVMVLIFGAAVPLVLSLVPIYFGETRLLIQPPLTSTLANVAQEEAFDVNVVSEVERLGSRSASIEVIERLKLDELPEFNPELREQSWKDWLKEYVQDTFNPPSEDEKDEATEETDETDPYRLVLPEYLRALSVGRSPTSGVIQIGFRSEDPQLAADVPNTLLDVYLEDRQKHLQRQYAQADGWFAERIDFQDQRVADAARAIQDFSQEVGLVGGPLEVDGGPTIADMMTARAALSRRKSALTAELEALSSAEDRDAKLALIDAPDVNALARDLRVSETKLETLKETFGERHEDVRAAQRAYKERSLAVDLALDQHVRSLDANISAIDHEDAALAKSIDAASATLAERSAALLQRDELQRRLQSEQDSLHRLREERQSVADKAKLPVAEFEVLSPAQAPPWPEGRGKSFWLLAALMAAGMLGLTAGVAAEVLDRAVRSFQQLRDVPSIMPAGMVSRISHTASIRLVPYLRRNPTSMFANAIRVTIRSLEHIQDGVFPQSLLITSASAGQGEALIASAIAVELASTGRGILLVDADLRRGTVHKHFNTHLRGRRGLGDYLLGRASVEDVVRHDRDSGVSFIPRGIKRPAGADLKAAYEEILAYAKSQDLVLIVVGPPILASTQTSVISDLVVQSLLVARWGRVDRAAIDTAAERLQSGRGAPIPVVISMVDPQRHLLYGFRDAAQYSRRLRPYLRRTG